MRAVWCAQGLWCAPGLSRPRARRLQVTAIFGGLESLVLISLFTIYLLQVVAHHSNQSLTIYLLPATCYLLQKVAAVAAVAAVMVA